MDHVEMAAQVEFTDADKRALRIIANGAGKATWYQVGRLVTPSEYPGQDTNAARILTRLEQDGLIVKTVDGGKMQPFTVTPKGIEHLRD